MTDLLSAFFVEIGVDRVKFDEGRAQALGSLDRLRDTALGGAAAIEESTRKAVGDSFRTLERHFLGFFAALLGTRSIVDFVRSTTVMETQLGILSSVLGTSVPQLSAFEMAVQRAGGSIEGANASLQALNSIVMQSNLEGQAGPQEFYRLGGSSIDYRADRVTQMIQFADAIAKTNYSEVQKIHMLGQMGIDAATSQLLLNPSVLRALIGQTTGDAVTRQQVEGGTKLTGAWFGASQAIQSFGRQVLLSLQGPMADLLKDLTSWVEANKDWAATWMGEKAREFKAWIDGINWDKVRSATAQVTDAVKSVVVAMGGWQHAAEGVVAAWVLLKTTPILSLGVALATMAAPLSSVLVGLAAVVAAFKVYENLNAPKPEHHWGPWHAGGSPTGPIISDPSKNAEGMRAWESRDLPSRSATPESAEVQSNGSFVTPGSGQAIETSEGAVSEGRPLPVKVTNLPEQDDTFWGYIGKALGKAGEWISRNIIHRGGGVTDEFNGDIIRPRGGARGAGSAGFGLYATDVGLAVNKDLTPEERAFLDTLGTGETPRGSYSNPDFDPGGLGGRYQFLRSTWVSEARKAGVDPANFSPENQDKVAAFYANEVIRQKTGQDLKTLLRSGPDGVRRAIAATSPGVWNGIANVDPDKSGHSGAVRLYLHKLEQEQKNVFPNVAPTTLPYVNPAAHDAANSAKVSMLVHDHHYSVARVDVTTHGASGSTVAREVRQHLERELSNFAVA